MSETSNVYMYVFCLFFVKQNHHYGIEGGQMLEGFL